MESKYSIEEIKANVPEEKMLEVLVVIANELAELNLRIWSLEEHLK